MGMCRSMGSHFHDSIDYNGFAFSIQLLECVAHLRDFGGRKIHLFMMKRLLIFTVSKRDRMFVSEVLYTLFSKSINLF